MRGGAFLRKPLPVRPAETVDEAAEKLTQTETTYQLQDAWYLHAERFAGVDRDRLRDVFTRQLRSFGALQG